LGAAIAVLEVGRFTVAVATAFTAILGTGVTVFLEEGHAVTVAAQWRDDGAFAGSGATLELTTLSAASAAAIRATLFVPAVRHAGALPLCCALFTLFAGATGTTAAVRATLFQHPLISEALGLADHFTEVFVVADSPGWAGSAGTAAAVGSTLLAATHGRAAAVGAAIILRLAGADPVPLAVAAERVHFANTLGDIRVFAADTIVRFTAISGAIAAVLGAFEAVFAAE
jgi:hypothetical protein